MRFHEESCRDAYDAVVVGSGIGGLAAAALLARAGKGVLVVERHDRPGGYAHAFRRRRYRFDSAIHLVGGCEPSDFADGGVVDRLLRAAGVRDRCTFLRVDPCYTAVFPGLELRAPLGVEEFLGAHADAFPAEEKGLRQLLQDCLAIRAETAAAAELGSPFEVVRSPGRFPGLLAYRRATLRDVLDDRLRDPQLKALIATLWPYLGLPPSELSFLYFATMLMSYVAEGAYACQGTFQRLADALVAAVERAGGEVLLRSSVRRIRVEAGRAAGVTLENGQQIAAPLVISNADALQTVDDLVGADHFPRPYRAGLRRMSRSISAFVLYLATDLDLPGGGLGHETFFYDGFDHEAAYRGVLAGEPSWLSTTVPTLADASLAPAGEHLLIVTTLVAPDAVARWGQAKPDFAARLLTRLEAHVPGLSGRLRFMEAATPRTMERYTRNTGGAIYGWGVTPAQVGPGRLANETPVPGLYLAGHWAQPGGGVVGVVRSGVQTARLVLGFATEQELWRSLGA